MMDNQEIAEQVRNLTGVLKDLMDASTLLCDAITDPPKHKIQWIGMAKVLIHGAAESLKSIAMRIG